ncbi:hypothetical protein ACQUY5_28865 [Bacillus cereus]|uniref:hypothetical protein n=1 Tax=Bacillus cereus TaxID=1396 RepID=UPI003D1860FC
MKAKKLVTFALPIMLMAGCTLNTYGLTQAEYKKVDKEFKADKMIEDMKKLHYKDEQIEAQLRGALSQLEYEEEQKNGKNTDSETEAKKEEKDEYRKPSLYVSATDYPEFMYDKLINLQLDTRTMKKESNAKAEGKSIGEPLQTLVSIRSVIENVERVDIPKKFTDYEYDIKDGVEAMKDSLPKLEKAIKGYEDDTKDKQKVNESIEKELDELNKGMSKWEPFFAGMDDKEFTQLKNVIQKRYSEKKDKGIFLKDSPSTADDSTDSTQSK